MIAILKELLEFFNKNVLNSINFWDCPSNNNWPLYSIVDKETKEFNLTPLFLCKLSWNFERKSKYDDILKTWKMIFQVFETRDRHFLDFLNDDLHSIEPLYTKEDS